MSDTAVFVRDVLAPVGERITDPVLRPLVEAALGSDKMAALARCGKVALFGTWHERDGLWYSNLHWDRPSLGSWITPEVRGIVRGIAQELRETRKDAPPYPADWDSPPEEGWDDGDDREQWLMDERSSALAATLTYDNLTGFWAQCPECGSDFTLDA